jgi:two-component system chemotaxis sensor kinase CheA
VVAVAAEEVESVEGREAVRGNGSPLYLARLSDGFELTSRIRADPKLAELPVVLVTALESREHRERGIEAGANAYVVKSSFDQSNLLEIIRRLA